MTRKYIGASVSRLFVLFLLVALLRASTSDSRSAQIADLNKLQVQAAPVKHPYSMQHHFSTSSSTNYHDGHILSKYLSIIGKMSTMDKGSFFTNSGDLPPANSTVRSILRQRQRDYSSLINSSTYQLVNSICHSYALNNRHRNEAQLNSLIDRFLKYAFSTQMYNRANQYLNSMIYGMKNTSLSDFLLLTRQIWFNQHTKTDGLSTIPAFQKVFCSPNKNWVQIFEREGSITPQFRAQLQQDGLLNVTTIQGQSLELSDGHWVMLGTSPEFELLAYTLCVLSTNTSILEEYHKCRFTVSPSNVEIVVIVKSSISTVINDKNHLQRHIVSDVDVMDGEEMSDEDDAAGTSLRKSSLPKDDPELNKLVKDMWDADASDRLPEEHIQLNWGNPASGTKDVSPENLITSLNENIFKRDVYQKLIDIYDLPVFNPLVCKEETALKDDRLVRIDDFLDTLINTTTFQLAYTYLQKKDKASKDPNEFRTVLFNHWFGNYSRCDGPLGSSGGEHVFNGEFKQNIVDGHHSWVHYWLAQKRGDINYHGYYTYRRKNLGIIQYTLKGYLKEIGGFFFRSSPAFDFSVFTVCVMTKRGNERCQFFLDNDRFFVTSFTQTCHSGTCISTSYPGTKLDNGTITTTSISYNAGTTTVPWASSGSHITDAVDSTTVLGSDDDELATTVHSSATSLTMLNFIPFLPLLISVIIVVSTTINVE